MLNRCSLTLVQIGVKRSGRRGGVDDDMLGVGMGCFGRSSLVVVGLWGWIWIRVLESNRADRLYRCNEPVRALMHTR